MRRIHKSGNEPHELQEQRLSDVPFRWANVDADTTLKHTIKAALLQEQGGLCAYTGIEIDMDSCHIEHLKPRACWEDGSDVEYTNMVACFPRVTGERGERYGATAKDRPQNWPCSKQELRQFATPLQDRCERCYEYRTDGRIEAADGNKAAQTTIEQLHLHDAELVALRRNAIDGFLSAFDQFDENARARAVRKHVEKLARASGQPKPSKLKAFVFVITSVFDSR